MGKETQFELLPLPSSPSVSAFFSSSNKQCSSSEEPRVSVYQRGEGDEEKNVLIVCSGCFFFFNFSIL